MYERFTDRARKVMQLANQEAQRFQHEYIGTEHILLGLVKEGSGVAAIVLANLDIDLRKIRLEVEKIVQAGPDMVTMGKLPQTPRAKKVIEYAMYEARDLNHAYVGTEHLLLGLIREQEGLAAMILMNLGLRLDQMRDEVLNLLGTNLSQEERLRRLDTPQTLRSKRKPPILDLPARAKQESEELDAQIARLRADKEMAVSEQCFELAAHIRDQEDKATKSKIQLINALLLAEFPIDAGWLAWHDGMVPKVAQMIAHLKRWENLPILADLLSQAGCGNEEILQHLRHPGEHGDRCWVIDLLLRRE